MKNTNSCNSQFPSPRCALSTYSDSDNHFFAYNALATPVDTCTPTVTVVSCNADLR